MSAIPDSAGDPVARIRTQIAQIRSALTQIDAELSRLGELPARARDHRRAGRYYALLVEIYERGPHGVSSEEFDQLARAFGYDRRGLNGYFAGLRAPLRASEHRVHLTLEGRRLVQEHLRLEP